MHSINEKKINSIILSEKINKIVKMIAECLDSIIINNKGFPARSFYGESFAYWLLNSVGTKYTSSIEYLYKSYQVKDKNDPNFHWEFNDYAWINLFKETNEKRLVNFAYPLHFKNTKVTNWTLLRSCTRYHAGIEIDLALQEAIKVLKKYQKKSGLICDQVGVRSFQYHCFSAVMIAEIYELGGGEFFLRRFYHAVGFISKFILRSGDTLYIGRGQEQSFGYGALIYLLALSYKYFQDNEFLALLQKCLSFLMKYQRKDGSFPLVMNKMERGFPLEANPSDPKYPGWYQYNNYFDYLPFLGIFLHKAAKVLSSVSSENVSLGFISNKNYRDRDFILFRNNIYEAVLSRPGGNWKGKGGYWTNDIPIPYVVCNGKRITPSYGGEQYGNTIYSPEGIPLPLIVKNNEKISIRRNRMWSFFLGNTMIFISLSGILIRHFKFYQSCIVIKDFMIGLKPMYTNYLFEKIDCVNNQVFNICNGAIIYTSKPMVKINKPCYFWGGILQSLVSCNPTRYNKITISMEKVQ